jgi:oligosaccharide repeat unit polymerase
MLLMVPLAILASRHFPDQKAFLLSPLCVFVFAWAVSAALYLTGDDFLRPRTVVALTLFYVAFLTGAGCVLIMLSRTLKANVQRNGPHRPGVIRSLLGLQALALVAAASHLYFAIVQAGGTLDLTAVRGVIATQTIDAPAALALLGQLRYVNYIAPIAIYSAMRAGAASRQTLVLSIALACLYPLFGLERSGILRIAMLLAFAYVYYSVNSLDRLLRFGVGSALLLVPVVIAVPLLRGQPEGINPYSYVTGAWSGLDNFVSGTGLHQVVVLEKGQEVYLKPDGFDLRESLSPPLSQSMTELYRICNALKLCHVPLWLPNEYVYTPVFTNIYTLARTFYQDFGMIGAPIATFIFAAFLTMVYAACVGNGGAFAVYVAAYTAYVCAMSVLSDLFLMRDIIFTGAFVYAIGWWFGSRTFWFGAPRHRERGGEQPTSDIA